jgi:hypothetical protein
MVDGPKRGRRWNESQAGRKKEGGKRDLDLAVELLVIVGFVRQVEHQVTRPIACIEKLGNLVDVVPPVLLYTFTRNAHGYQVG